MTLRQKVVNTAVSYLGCKESDGSHKKIIDLYNAHTPRARGYKVKYTDAWCATFGSAVAIQLGLTDIIPTECSCVEQIELFKKLGAWVERDDYIPSPGDWVFYDWNAKKGECTGAPDHVGIVVSVSGKTIRVIEGNYDNQVKYRDICVEYVKVRGYGVPKYEAKEARDMKFVDVDKDAWYYEAVKWAVDKGIIKGVDATHFAPDEPCTRAEVVAMLYRALK